MSSGLAYAGSLKKSAIHTETIDDFSHRKFENTRMEN